MNKNIGIIVYSRAGENYNVGTLDKGNTEIVAEQIQKYLGNADLIKIEPAKEYPIDYQECIELAMDEKNNGTRPAIKNEMDTSKYDTIFLGYPIWWEEVPMIINTFLESYDLKGKTIIPFNTHEGSGSAGTYEYLKNKLPESNVILKGLPIQGKDSSSDETRERIANWIKELNL